jgi:DNA-binding phage protein
MPLSRSFKETVKERIEEDPAFRDALLAEGIDALLSGEVDVGKAILRDYLNATIGFAKLAKETGIPVKSLMRMFGPAGNPSARNLFSVIGVLQSSSGTSLRVRPRPRPPKSQTRKPASVLRRAG